MRNVLCDLPAAHKVCGFLSHSSNHCSRCTKKFPYDEDYGKLISSGFEVHQPRTQCAHKAAGISWLAATTKKAREKVETYFDCIRFTIIDPTYNLFLGTAKHVMKNIWLKNGFIQKQNNEKIHGVVENAYVPSSVGRLPIKILSGFVWLHC